MLLVNSDDADPKNVTKLPDPKNVTKLADPKNVTKLRIAERLCEIAACARRHGNALAFLSVASALFDDAVYSVVTSRLYCGDGISGRKQSGDNAGGRKQSGSYYEHVEALRNDYETLLRLDDVIDVSQNSIPYLLVTLFRRANVQTDVEAHLLRTWCHFLGAPTQGDSSLNNALTMLYTYETVLSKSRRFVTNLLTKNNDRASENSGIKAKNNALEPKNNTLECAIADPHNVLLVLFGSAAQRELLDRCVAPRAVHSECDVQFWLDACWRMERIVETLKAIHVR